jgi:hypothetical protein
MNILMSVHVYVKMLVMRTSLKTRVRRTVLTDTIGNANTTRVLQLLQSRRDAGQSVDAEPTPPSSRYRFDAEAFVRARDEGRGAASADAVEVIRLPDRSAYQGSSS